MCVVGIQREFAHIFLLWRGPFLWSSATAGEHTWYVCFSDPLVSPFAWETSGSLPFAWATNGSLPFTWATSGFLPSVQIYRPYIVFSSPMRKYEHPLRQTYFSVCSWLSELTYFRVFFFGNLLILSANGNICHSINHILFPMKLPCWCYLVTALNPLSSSSPAKLVYYMSACELRVDFHAVKLKVMTVMTLIVNDFKIF